MRRTTLELWSICANNHWTRPLFNRGLLWTDCRLIFRGRFGHDLSRCVGFFDFFCVVFFCLLCEWVRVIFFCWMSWTSHIEIDDFLIWDVFKWNFWVTLRYEIMVSCGFAKSFSKFFVKVRFVRWLDVWKRITEHILTKLFCNIRY